MNTLFPERLTRSHFLIRCIITGFLTVPVRLHFRLIREGSLPLWDWAGVALVLVIAVYSIVFVAVPRGVDIGLSKILSGLLAAVPMLNVFFWLFLLFTKTDAYRKE